jgi:dTDP-4-amino-4,6-dideoxygalactose transaminase
MFSTKVITSGEGGVVVTNDARMAEQIRLLRDYGKPSRWISYSVQFGLNWRLNELAAIVGIAQLRRLDEFIAWRAKIAAIYDRELAADPSLTRVVPFDRCSWYKYIVKLPDESAREPLKSFLQERGVAMPGGVYDLPLHRQPVFAGQFDATRFPVADDFCARHVCLPIYYGLDPDDARYVAQSLRAFFEGYASNLRSPLQI